MTFAWHPDDYAITFSRVSDEIQDSVGDQVKMNLRCATDILGLPVPKNGSYTETISRSQFSKRVDLQAALRRMEDPHCKAIISWIPSRLFGDPEQTIAGYRIMSRNGVRLFDKNGREEDVSSHLGKLMGMLQGWQSEGEVLELRKRVGDTHRMKAEDGRMISRPPYGVDVVPLGALPCHGTCIDDGKGCEIPHGEKSKKGTVWIINKEHQATLAMMYDWAANGIGFAEMERRLAKLKIVSPVREITRSLHNKGKIRGGTPWSKSNIRKMLLNEFYRGYFVWNTVRIIRFGDEVQRVPQPEAEWIRAPHSLGPFVDATVWDEAKRQIELRHKTRDENRKYPAKVFDGLIYCGRCAWRMHPRRRAHKRTNGVASVLFDYHCVGAYNAYCTCTRNHAIPESWLFNLLGVNLNDKIVFPDVTVSYERASEDNRATTAELTSIDDALREIVNALDRIADLLVDGDISKAKGRERKAEALARRDVLTSRQAELLARPAGEKRDKNAPAALLSLAPLLLNESIPIQERRLTVSRLIDRIVIDRPSVRVILREEAFES